MQLIKKKQIKFSINTWTTALSRLCSGSWKCDVGYLLQDISLVLPWQHAVNHVSTWWIEGKEKNVKRKEKENNGKINQ